MKKNSYIFSIVRIVLIFIVSYFTVVWIYKTILKNNTVHHSVYAKNYVKDLIAGKNDYNISNLYNNKVLLNKIQSKVKQHTGFDFNLLKAEDRDLKNELKKENSFYEVDNGALLIYYPLDKNNYFTVFSKDINQVYYGIGYFKIIILILFIFVLVVRLYTLYYLYKAQKKSEKLKKELDESQIQFTNIANIFEDVFFVYDFELEKIEFIGAKCLKLLGFNQNELYDNSKLITSVIIDEDKEKHKEAIKQLKETKQPHVIDYRIKVNNEIKNIREHAYPLFDDNKNVVKMSGLLSDMTTQIKQDNEIKKIYKNTKLLSEVGYEISQNLTVESITKNMYLKLNQMMKADYFGIGIIDKVNGTINFPYFIEFEEVYSSSYSLASNVLPAICVKTKQTIFINEHSEIASYTQGKRGKTEGGRAESIVYLPLFKKKEVIGVITVQSVQQNAFTEIDKEFLKNISAYVVRALDKAEQYEELELIVEERTKDLALKNKKLELAYTQEELLSKIGSELSSTLKIDSIFDKLYDSINKMIDANMFSIRLVDWDKETITYKYNIENGVRMPAVEISLKDDDNYTVWSIKNNQVVFINDNQKEYSKYVKEIKVPFGKMPNSLLFVPLVNNDKVLGVITVQSFEYNAYSSRDLHILKTLAFYTSIAISNAQLYESLELKVQERTIKLKEANKNLLDSIIYTKNIQDSTLTDKEDIDLLLNDNFIFYKPKDILSGDFYRVDKINDELTTIIVGDCTGHGVPGASLAILCSNIFKQGLINPNITKPSDLLTFTRDNLISYFKNSKTKIHDGLDGSVLLLNHKTLELQFSGAFNNVYIVRDGEMIILKGDRMHVGFEEVILEFTNQSFQLQKGDNVFLTTDGFSDQFGGEKYKKYSKKRTLQLFSKIAPYTSEQQLEMLESEFNNWKKDYNQIDDVCVLGFKV